MQVKGPYCPGKMMLIFYKLMWSVFWEVPHVKFNQTVERNLPPSPPPFLICANLLKSPLAPYKSSVILDETRTLSRTKVNRCQIAA